jgi:PHD/YefM family antitoxin component YafN of YafNO toxin-antitoxin module
MKEIGFSEFRVKCSAVFEQVRKTRQPIRVTRFGNKPLAEIVPLSSAKNEPVEKKLQRSSPRPLKAHRGR